MSWQVLYCLIEGFIKNRFEKRVEFRNMLSKIRGKRDWGYKGKSAENLKKKTPTSSVKYYISWRESYGVR